MKLNLKILIIYLSILHITLNQSHQSGQSTIVQILDTNIPTPTHIQIIKQSHNLTSQVTVPQTIQSPDMIYPIYNTKIFNDTNRNCWLQYKLVQKQYGDYIKFQKDQLGYFDQWPVQIIDSTYSLTKQKIYFLLTNGSLLVTNMTKQLQNPKKLNNFQVFNYNKNQSSSNSTTINNNSIKAIWQLDQYDMWITGQKLYMVKDRQLYTVSFNEQYQWSIQKNSQGTYMQQVIKYKDHLYFVKNDGIHKISPEDGSISKNLINFQAYQNKQQIQFVSIAIYDNKMYILCRQQGIFLIDMQNNFQIIKVYPIDYPVFAHRIHVFHNTILVNYKFYRRTFIAQLFMIPSLPASQPPMIKLNKFFYRFEEMQHIIMFQNFGLVYSFSEMNIFQHSLNRNSPFSQLDTEVIDRSSYPKILDVIQLDQKELKYILIEKNGIFVERLGKVQKNGNKATSNLLSSSVRCVFSKPGFYSVNITYQGLCKQHSNPTQSYCSKMDTYNFEVNSEKQSRIVQKYNDHAFLVLMLLLILVLVIGAVLTYRRITEERRQKLMALLQKRAQSQNQMISTISAGGAGINNTENSGQTKVESSKKEDFQE